MTSRLRPDEPLVGVSPEVIDHHLMQHPCRSDAVPTKRWCPCRRSFVLCCGECEQIVFVIAPTGSLPCEHLLELLEATS